MNWISVDDALPEIEEGKYAVMVLICEHDPVYEEINPGHGSHVSTAMYMKQIPEYPELGPDFQIMLLGGGKPNVTWTFPLDEITHWMYYPEPIQKRKINEEVNYCDLCHRSICSCNRNCD